MEMLIEISVSALNPFTYSEYHRLSTYKWKSTVQFFKYSHFEMGCRFQQFGSSPLSFKLM